MCPIGGWNWVAKPGAKNVTHVTFEVSTPAATAWRCAVCASGLSVPPTVVLKTVFFEPRNSKTVLFVAETCPRKSKRGFFVTFNANFYLRNRKLLLRRCKLPGGRLRWCRLLGGKLPRGRLRLRRCNLPLRRRRLLRGRLRRRKVRGGRLPWRMVLGNVAENTPLRA